MMHQQSNRTIATATERSARSRLFSATVYREMAEHGFSPSFANLFKLANMQTGHLSGSTVADAFDAVFAKLKKSGQRDEYVYRAAIAQKVLMGKHSLNTATMLTEYRAGTCKADLVLLNGSATVYEIKSERDSLDRLKNQIANYRLVFPTINIITGDKFVEEVLASTSADVGVLRLSARNRIQVVREARAQCQYLCPITMFESLRSAEAKAVLRLMGETVEDVPNTQLHSNMKRIFRRQNPETAHRALVTVLKRSRNLAPLKEFVGCLPASLQTAALSIKVNKKQRKHVVRAVSTPLNEAVAWGQ